MKRLCLAACDLTHPFCSPSRRRGKKNTEIPLFKHLNNAVKSCSLSRTRSTGQDKKSFFDSCHYRLTLKLFKFYALFFLKTVNVIFNRSSRRWRKAEHNLDSVSNSFFIHVHIRKKQKLLAVYILGNKVLVLDESVDYSVDFIAVFFKKNTGRLNNPFPGQAGVPVHQVVTDYVNDTCPFSVNGIDTGKGGGNFVGSCKAQTNLT